MALLAARDLSKTHASIPLFERLSITFHPGERVGLIGPNGGGKTTLLKILAGAEHADSGVVERAKDASLVYLPQVDIFPADDTVESALLAAVRSAELEEHEYTVRARKMLRRLGFDTGDRPVEALSGGWRKRLAIGCALVQEPDLLLLDEPTNHLDLAGIEWLERFLARSRLSFILTSHDRYFLERVANRIVEINPRYPDGFFSVDGHYSDFLERREAFLQMQDAQRQALANEVRREVEWLRRGPKARSSKAGYRIDEAHRKIDELTEAKRRHNSETELEIDFSASGRRTHDLITAQGVEKTLGGRLLFRGVDVHVRRGTRLGIAGNNASGKTTLLKTLAGTLSPDDGNVKQAVGLSIALFDQQRSQLDESETLRRTLAPSGDTVSYLGRGTHVVAWAKRFGFQPDQLAMPVGELSGGEQARALMAMMMREPADVLMLDEPTNDLDIASIEVLEQALLGFPGAVVVITHDRHLLDRICTELIGLHGDGRWGSYASVAQWQEVCAAGEKEGTAAGEKASQAAEGAGDRGRKAASNSGAGSPRKGLSFHEKREFAGMEERILAAEEYVETLRAQLNDPAVAVDHEKLHATYEAHREAQAELDRLFARWEELERKSLGE
jgi:ATP-binding cassette subfamily F protein uup